VYDRTHVIGIIRGTIAAFAHASIPLVLAGLALHLVGLAVTGERWRVVIAALGTRLRLSRTVLINLAGIFVRNATPTTGLGGDASRIALLRAEGVPIPQATASFVYVRAAEALPVALLVALSTPVALTIVSRSRALVIGGALVLAAAAVTVWLERRTLAARLAGLWERTAHLRISRAALTLAIVYAAIAQIETLARQMVLATAFGLPLTIQQAATVTVMGIAGGFVPTVGGIGAIDGSLVAGLMLCGATAETAVAITVAERAISYGLTTAMGAAALALLGGRGLLRAVSERRTNAATAG
jgi:glycosyltransferase 2 family protein